MTFIAPSAWEVVAMILLPRPLGLRITPAVPSSAPSIRISAFVSLPHVSALAITPPPLLASSSLAVLISSTDKPGRLRNSNGNTADSDHIIGGPGRVPTALEAVTGYTLGSWDSWDSL